MPESSGHHGDFSVDKALDPTGTLIGAERNQIQTVAESLQPGDSRYAEVHMLGDQLQPVVLVSPIPEGGQQYATTYGNHSIADEVRLWEPKTYPEFNAVIDSPSGELTTDTVWIKGQLERTETNRLALNLAKHSRHKKSDHSEDELLIGLDAVLPQLGIDELIMHDEDEGTNEIVTIDPETNSFVQVGEVQTLPESKVPEEHRRGTFIVGLAENISTPSEVLRKNSATGKYEKTQKVQIDILDAKANIHNPLLEETGFDPTVGVTHHIYWDGKEVGVGVRFGIERSTRPGKKGEMWTNIFLDYNGNLMDVQPLARQLAHACSEFYGAMIDRNTTVVSYNNQPSVEIHELPETS